jgi:hypothetical protein
MMDRDDAQGKMHVEARWKTRVGRSPPLVTYEDSLRAAALDLSKVFSIYK